MDSALSPREIQARIRSGESLEEVATAAGVPAERIEPFAAPVLAERAHVAGSALAAPVRRVGEPATNHQPLRVVVAERCEQWGLEPDDVDWDAWKLENRKWLVRGAFTRDGEEQEARFRYDQLGRFNVADNDVAKELIGERTAPPPAAPRDPDAEPTLDYTDEFALVRAVGAEAPREPAESETGDGDEPRELTITEIRQLRISEGDIALPPTQLRQVDGVYDLVPDTGGLDMIYDLLGGYAEEGAPYDFDQVPAVGEETDSEAAATPDDASADSTPAAEPEPTENAWSRLSRRQRQKLRREQAAQEKKAAQQQPATEAEPAESPALDESAASSEAEPAEAYAPEESSADTEPAQAVDADEATAEATAAAGDAADLDEVALTAADLEPTSPSTAADVIDVEELDDIALPFDETDQFVEPAGSEADAAAPEPTPVAGRTEQAPATEPERAGAEATQPAPHVPEAPDVQTEPEPAPEPKPEPEPTPERDPEPQPAPDPEPAELGAPAPASAAGAPVAEPTQDALLDGPAPAKPAPRPKKKRASVPSWDEIMFGGPKPEK